MEQNNPRILSLESQLNSMAARIADLERRVKELEGKLPAQKPTSQATQAPKANPQPATPIGHKYLSRAISSAKRDHERKYL